jgi:hypothetical protein
MTMAIFKYGKPVMVKEVPAVSYSAGDVIVKENIPFIAHVDNPPFGTTVITGALAAGGGVYTVTADAAYKVGTYVYWDPTNSKVTTGVNGTVPFGWIVAGPSGYASDGGPTTDGDLCDVLHAPSAAPDLVLTLGVTANDNITNTNSETAFATIATIPAATLQAGDVVRVKAVAQVNAQNSTNTNQFKLAIETAVNTFTTIYDSTALNIAASGLAVLDFDLVFTAVGNSGSFYAVGAAGTGNTGASLATKALAATAINTTSAVRIRVTDTQSAASTGNVAQLLLMEARIKRK